MMIIIGQKKADRFCIRQNISEIVKHATAIVITIFQKNFIMKLHILCAFKMVIIIF